MIVESAPGQGRTRLLAELALEARLAGAAVLEAEAHAGRGTHGIANEYALRLLDALPAGLAVSAPRQRATCLELGPLSLAHTAELFRSVFGDVQHLPRLVDLVYERSEGDPAHALDLAEHLSREGVIGFANGAWVLPQMVADGALPANRLDADLARLSRLSVQARELGRALSVREGPIPLEMCAALATSRATSCSTRSGRARARPYSWDRRMAIVYRASR